MVTELNRALAEFWCNNHVLSGVLLFFSDMRTFTQSRELLPGKRRNFRTTVIICSFTTKTQTSAEKVPQEQRLLTDSVFKYRKCLHLHKMFGIKVNVYAGLFPASFIRIPLQNLLKTLGAHAHQESLVWASS